MTALHRRSRFVDHARRGLPLHPASVVVLTGALLLALSGCSDDGAAPSDTTPATSAPSTGVPSTTTAPPGGVVSSAAQAAQDAVSSASSAASSVIAQASSAVKGSVDRGVKGDVTVNGCHPGQFGTVAADLTVTNSQSQAQAYAVTVTAKTPDGRTVATLAGAAGRVEAGRSQTVTAVGLAANPPDDLRCEVSDVTRVRV